MVCVLISADIEQTGCRHIPIFSGIVYIVREGLDPWTLPDLERERFDQWYHNTRNREPLVFSKPKSSNSWGQVRVYGQLPHRKVKEETWVMHTNSMQL